MVRTRLLILSDSHTTPPFPSSGPEIVYRQPLPDADILIHTGDLTLKGYREEYGETIDLLASHPAELKLVIAGNHDLTLDEAYVLGPHGRRHARHSLEDCRAVMEMWCSPESKERGIRYLEEGAYSFTLRNGASFTVYASPYQPVFDNWAFAYERHQDRFNPFSSSLTNSKSDHLPDSLLALAANPIPGALPPFPTSSPSEATHPIPSHPAIDILLTHGPPLGILDAVASAPHYNVGCAHLLQAAARCRPLVHAFGHIHEGWGGVVVDWESGQLRDLVPSDCAEDGRQRWNESVLKEGGVRVDLTANGIEEEVQWGRETAFVNASVMDVHYRPVNAPWIVDLELPVRKQSGDQK